MCSSRGDDRNEPAAPAGVNATAAAFFIAYAPSSRSVFLAAATRSEIQRSTIRSLQISVTFKPPNAVRLPAGGKPAPR